MEQAQQQLIAALVDGELRGAELDAALRLVQQNPAAQSLYLRFQQQADVLHGYTTQPASAGLAFFERVSERIAQEPTFATSAPARKVVSFPKLQQKQWMGWAMAASVGAFAVVGVLGMQSSFLAPVAPTAIAQIENAAPQSNRWTVTEPEVEHRLNNYLLDHNEYAGASGVFSYGRVVSYGAE